MGLSVFCSFSFLRSISLSISSEILLTVICAYFCVLLILECPIILETLSMFTPAETNKVAFVWRAS